jgi:cGMP-specific 3',5'-cyclic phosphodiesterase, invertebrate
VLGVDSNICAAALTRRNLSALDENELFMELIRDVANELDINVLCHKILVNVELLTHADRGSLFLARGPREARYLVAKLFDVTVDTGNKKLHFHILVAKYLY